MNAIDAVLAGPAGPYVAIVLMAFATFACRASGVLFVSRIAITPRIQRGLRALPGSIVVATVLPIAAQAGPAAFVGLAIGAGTMALTRFELGALLAGLAGVAGARALGL